MGKLAQCERVELHVAFQKIAVHECGKIESAQRASKSLGMNVCESAVHKIAANEAFFRKVDSGKCHSCCVQSHDFVVIFYIVQDILRNFSRIRGVVKAIPLVLDDIVVFVDF